VDGNADFESTDDLTVTCLDGRCTAPHDGTNICTAKQSCSTTSLEKRDGEVSCGAGKKLVVSSSDQQASGH
ncbi:hypothetical protein PFISCL1PPCAC_26535, partial [Pristionchus fissidentatus]